MKNILTTLLMVTFVALVLPVLAQENNLKISVQGTLKDPNGLAIDDGPQTITFRLFDQAVGGAEKHEETAILQVRGGVYSYLLGTNTSFDSLGIFKKTLYLELTVGDAAEPLNPRTQMTYAPYALSVETAQQAILADSSKVSNEAYGLVSGDQTCSGAVGDIKYSILTPDQFVMENGDCWVPMDGRDISGSKLDNDYGWESVPNMSGLFIRSAEFHVNGQTDYDPDRSDTTEIGEYQQDEFENHTHNYTDATDGTGGLVKDNNGTTAEWPSVNTSATTETGGSETRPKNRNFYVYIRVN